MFNTSDINRLLDRLSLSSNDGQENVEPNPSSLFGGYASPTGTPPRGKKSSVREPGSMKAVRKALSISRNEKRRGEDRNPQFNPRRGGGSNLFKAPPMIPASLTQKTPPKNIYL